MGTIVAYLDPPVSPLYTTWSKYNHFTHHTHDLEDCGTNAQADILVLATPVYVDGMTDPMKTLLDRLVPLLRGRFEIWGDHCQPPRARASRRGR